MAGEVQWTEDQKKVITLQNKDLLVSAAAGSGKTAVLVERIIQKILSPKDPVDVDRILVVTFTRAAAREMREKIRNALDAALERDPGNRRLRKQKILLSHARITTIDSFCRYVVSDHFEDIGIDPDFRVADESETGLLASEVLDDVFNACYEKNDSVFTELVHYYGTAGDDGRVRGIVQALYNTSESFPWPEKWLEDAAESYGTGDEEAWDNSKWMQQYTKMEQGLIRGLLPAAEEALLIASEDGGPLPWIPSLKDDITLFTDAGNAGSPAELRKILTDGSFSRLSTKKSPQPVDPELKEQVKKLRDAYKKTFGKIQTEYTAAAFSRQQEVMALSRPYAEKLIELALTFSKAFAREKRKEKIADFSDIEHFALEILVDRKTGDPKPAALSFQNLYREVMVDEYQDSNAVQEMILSAVSSSGSGRHDYFMVGDVKQSIYRFRQADPSIFIGKYTSFSEDPAADQMKIILGKNFRSRQEVLSFSNGIFSVLMQEDLGGVAYNSAAELHLGAEYPAGKPGEFAPEVLCGIAEEAELSGCGFRNRKEFEAALIAARIRRLLKDGRVRGEGNTMRPVVPGDIVILLRSMTEAETIRKAVETAGVPCRAVVKEEFFASPEIEAVVSFLQLVDNPLQDIPMASVLHSAMYDVDDDELSEIHVEEPDRTFSEAALLYGSAHPESAVHRMTELLSRLRAEAPMVHIYDLITRITEETGFLDHVGALPGGADRLKNIERLQDEAEAFEAQGGSGVFRFILYIRQMQKYEIDLPGAESGDDAGAYVRIMTMHKSKGLEFPVVFVSMLGKGFNKEDSKGVSVIHPTYGLGLDLIRGRYRTRSKSAMRTALAALLREENIGEEIRVLYVALTRAKEKLILTGTLGKESDWRDPVEGRPLTLPERLDAASFLQWILEAAGNEKAPYSITAVHPADVEDALGGLVEEPAEKAADVLKRLDAAADPKAEEALDSRLSFVYPGSRKVYRNKYSVSELKHMEAAEEQALKASEEATEDSRLFWTNAGSPENAAIQNRSASDEEESENQTEISQIGDGDRSAQGGAAYGTAMHRFLELYDYAAGRDPAAAAEEMCHSGRMTEEEQRLLSYDALSEFLATPLAERMHQAALSGQLHREQSFMMGSDAAELFGDRDADQEMILVQGVIDAWFLEDNEIILVDYKTDHVKTAETLKERYARQLDLYAAALGRALHREVSEKLLYSFALGAAIQI